MKKVNCIFLLLSLIFCYSCTSQTNSKFKSESFADLPKIELEKVGINADSISRIINLINTVEPFDFRGLVVLKNDSIAIEEYFNTYWRYTIHDIRSAGKSITALLLGIAIDKGLIKDVEQNIYDFFPKYKKSPNRDIRIKHLLMMSSGLDADTFDENSEGNGINWRGKNDWVGHVLQLSMKFTPGEKWVYNDASAMLIGAIIEEQSGQKLSDFANQHLFKPLGIREYYWFTGLSGRTGAMGNLYISTLDFAKIGQLVLNNGEWNGKQLISNNWINEISTPHFNIENIPFAKKYGYFWYFSNYKANGIDYEYLYAAGNGGNLLFIVPEENMTVALVSSAYGQDRGQFRSNKIFELILESIEK